VEYEEAEAESASDRFEASGDDIAAARRGSSAGLGRILERYRPYLLAIAMQELPKDLAGKLGASDVVQASLLKGCEQFPSFRGNSPEELSAWLRQILLSHLLNVAEAYRAQKREVKREQSLVGHLVDVSQLSPSGEAVSREMWESLQGALDRLPEHYRRIILLRHRDDLSFAEIGRVTNQSDEAARKVWSRAIRKLQGELSDS
jgi:RNA polymerase sigma-70 factor (ECF subfamily)